ncbi:MAG TPA: D-ribose ABC transporter substrate-binding protein [Pirellulales bacterium]
MSTRRQCLAILVLCFASISMTACSSTPAGKSEGGKDKVAVVVSTKDNPWFVVLADAAAGRAKELGYDVSVFDSQNDPGKEAATFDNIITGGFKAVLFNPTDSEASIANVRKAKAAGIPVFCIDREINANDAAASQILSDSSPGCIELGQYFVKTLGGKGEYVELQGILGDNNTKIRSEGFHSVVDHSPGLKMVAQKSADFNRDKANDAMQSILQANPNIVAVFCGNDAMALGAYQALVTAGKDKQVKVFGFDGADEVVKLIGQGKIQATCMQFPKKMARTAAEEADQWIKGKHDFEQKTLVGVELVTPENVANYGDYGSKEEATK